MVTVVLVERTNGWTPWTTLHRETHVHSRDGVLAGTYYKCRETHVHSRLVSTELVADYLRLCPAERRREAVATFRE